MLVFSAKCVKFKNKRFNFKAYPRIIFTHVELNSQIKKSKNWKSYQSRKSFAQKMTNKMSETKQKKCVRDNVTLLSVVNETHENSGKVR